MHLIATFQNSNQKHFGVILQYLQMLFNILIQLIYTPILLRTLGSIEYGIYNVTLSIISYLSLLSFGLGASYFRYYSIFKSKNKTEDLKKLNGLYLIVFIIIGILSFFIGFYLTINTQFFYSNQYSPKDIEIARTLMFILSINLAITFPTSVFISYTTSQEKFIFLKTISIFQTIITPIISIICLFNGYGSIGMAITTTLVTITTTFIIVWYCLNKLKMEISFNNIDYSLLKDIFIFSIFIAINQIIDLINWQTDKIILGKLCNGISVAIYSVGASINSLFTHFSTAISNVYAPQINMIVSQRKEGYESTLNQIFIQVGRIQWYVLSLVLTGFIFFGKYFIKIWAGIEFTNSYWVTLLLITPAIIPLIQNIGIEIQRAENKHQFRSIIYAFMALFNILLSINLAKLWNEIGVAIGTTASLLLANGLIMNIFYHKILKINIIQFWKSIFSTLKGYFFPITFGIILTINYEIDSLFYFIIFIIIYIFIFIVSIFNLSMNNEEKYIIKKTINKFIRRKSQ